jgi:hypothetical protein
MNPTPSMRCTAFAGNRQIACGELRLVALKAWEAAHSDQSATLLIFDDATSKLIEIDFRGSPEGLLDRLGEINIASAPTSDSTTSEGARRGPGRPKLGVVAREVTLLPRHWDWLGTQPGGASVALRKLVEQARRSNQGADRLRHAQEATYRFMSTMAGNEAGFEEAARALFAGNVELFLRHVESWPIDVGNHAKKLAARVFEETNSSFSSAEYGIAAAGSIAT